MATRTKRKRNITRSATHLPSLLRVFNRVSKRRSIAFKLLDYQCTGFDFWDCFELTWLNFDNKPEFAEVQIMFFPDTDNAIESKSMKLYLNSFAFAQFEDYEAIEKTIEFDLNERLGKEPNVHVYSANSIQYREPPEDSIDLDFAISRWPNSISVDPTKCPQPRPDLLRVSHQDPTHATWVTNCFYSLCPNTGQPDQAEIVITIDGMQPDPAHLLAYLVSYRSTFDFHETCIERIYKDLWECLRPQELEVQGKFRRRGGIAINPVRFTSNLAR